MKTSPSIPRRCLLVATDSAGLLPASPLLHRGRVHSSPASSTVFFHTAGVLGLLSHGLSDSKHEAGLFSTADAGLVPRADSNFGPYRMVKRLGNGGFGDVWLAEQQEPLHRQVALKLIRADLLGVDAISRFKRERQAMAMMEHENIAKVYDASSIDGTPYFAMEYVPGLPITSYVKAKNLTLRQRIELFIPVCRAVHHAHQKLVLHRDLKPANILVAERDGVAVPKVIDFGIAKPLSEQHRLVEAGADEAPATLPGFRLGTPQYMSPEQALGLADIDASSDTYALGVVLYEMLVGEPPITRHEMKDLAPHEQLDRVIRHQTLLPSTLWLRSAGPRNTRCYDRTLGDNPKRISHQMRGDLDWIVQKALEKDCSRRYASADKLADDLAAYLRNDPVSAGPPSLGYRLHKSFLRHQSTALAACLVLFAILSCGVAFDQWRRAEASYAHENHARAGSRLTKAQAMDVVGFVLRDLGPKLQAVNQAGLLEGVSAKAAAYYAAQGPALRDDSSSIAAGSSEQALQGAVLYRGSGPRSSAHRGPATAIVALAVVQP